MDGLVSRPAGTGPMSPGVCARSLCLKQPQRGKKQLQRDAKLPQRDKKYKTEAKHQGPVVSKSVHTHESLTLLRKL